MAIHNNDTYNDYKPNSFMMKAKQTVYKWWCVVYRPVYKLTHNGMWPAYMEPENKYPTNNASSMADSLAQSALSESVSEETVLSNFTTDVKSSEDFIQASVDSLINAAANKKDDAPATEKPIANELPAQEEEVDLSSVDSDTLDKANEIMARLAREAAEDEAKKQAEIEEAKRKANEQFNSANNATDKNDTTMTADEIAVANADSDTLDKANEIMARLAREAAEDEAKKQAEIEEAKRKADEATRLAQIMNANKVDINGFIEEGRSMKIEDTESGSTSNFEIS